MTVETIDDAIAAMDRRLERAAETDDPRGYFTCVHRAMTARVRDGIAAGDFDDPERMERFDVRFANLDLGVAEAERDARVAAHAEAIVRPRAMTRALLAAARRRERADVAGVAAALRRRGADVPT